MRLSWALAWLLAGCFFGDGGGGGPGVPGNTRLPDLDAMQRTQLCEHLAAEYPPRQIDCGDFTISIGFTSSGQCEGALPTRSTCTATVDQTAACLEDLYALTDDAFCTSNSVPASCGPLFSDGCQEPDPARTHWLP